jgi:ATP/ADP translocase/HEAT repeat protein
VRYLHQLLLIEEEEAGTVFYFLALLLVIGAGMALGRATANALFLKRIGIDYLPVLYLAQGATSFVASLFYVGIADLISAERFFKTFFAVLATSVLAFWLLISLSDSPVLFPAYFLFYEVVSEVLLIHSALYLSQNLNTLQAKRLSPVILSGMQIGTVLGGLFLAAYAPVLGTRNMLLVWLSLVLAALLMVWLWHRHRGSSPYFRSARKSANTLHRMSEQIQQGFRFARDSELLRLTTMAMVFMVITYYIINYSVKRVYTDSYASEDSLTAFFGVLTIWTSSLALVVQLFLTNRLVRRFGVPTVNLFYPLASLGSFIGMIFHLGLPSAVAASVNIESVMPAFHNPVQTIFLNVLPQHIQGRARAMSLAIVLPISLITCGILLWFLQKMDNPQYFLVPGATAAALFVYFSIRMNHAYGETLLTHLKEHLFLPREQSAASLRNTGKESIAAITAAVDRGDEMSVSFAGILVEAYPEMAADHILPVVERTTAGIADQLIKLASTTRDPAVFRFLLERTGLHDNHFRATALSVLSNAGIEDAVPLLRQALDDPDPRIQATAIRAVLAWPLTDQGIQAVANWLALLNGSANEQLAALELIPAIRHIQTPATRETVEQACLTSSARIFDTVSVVAKAHILSAYSKWDGASNSDIQALVDMALEHTDPQIRAAAVQCMHLLPEAQRQDRLESALADGHARVRNAALENLRKQVPDAIEFVLTWMIEDNRGSPRAQNTLLSSVIEKGMPQGALESIINKKIADARQIYGALATVRHHRQAGNSALELLCCVLEERLQQILEIALTAMEPLCPPGVIAVIRGGISTRDKRYVANACEALQSIPNRKLVQPLGQLIQDAFMPAHRAVSPATEKLEGVLESLATRPDAWLRECAGVALAATRGAASG